MIGTLRSMSATWDLSFDPNDVGNDLVVECWVSQSPRANDVTFDPQPGDWLTVGDDDEAPLNARVTRRDGNRVWVQVDILSHVHVVA